MSIDPRIAAAASALAVALTLPGAASASTPARTGSGTHAEKTRVIADCAHRKVKPRKVIATCGDAGEWAVIKRYGSWKAKVAWGSGRLHLNDCDPTCADGTDHSYRATFRFHRVVDTDAGPMFSRLGVTYVMGGEQHNAELRLPVRPL